MQIYEQTKDEHFSLIIVDYGSVDMDIPVEANRSTFKRWVELDMGVIIMSVNFGCVLCEKKELSFIL